MASDARSSCADWGGLPPWLDPDDGRPPVRERLAQWLLVQHALALAPQTGWALLRENPDPRVAWIRSRKRSKRSFDPDRAIAGLARARAVALPVLSPAYPERLAALSDPALVLHVRGDPTVLGEPSVAVVGSRAATVYGRRVARRLAADLASAGAIVVSGLARGIDAEAHLGALEAGGRTVAVQARGLDRVYPREHRGLAERIADSGAVISELPLGTPPQRAFFPLRNRLISGLCQAVVVVEARKGSGSLITASHAADQGREVFAVPGPVTAPTSAGTNRLLTQGAGAALGVAEILREIPPIPRPPAPPPPREQAVVLAALARGPATRDELARRLEASPDRLALDLLELELRGCVAEDRDGRLHVVDLPD